MSAKQWFIRDIGSSANLLDGSERQTLITTGNEINFFKLNLTKKSTSFIAVSLLLFKFADGCS